MVPVIMNSITEVKTDNRVIRCYEIGGKNIDPKTVSSFGDEWKAFHGFDKKDLKLTGDMYFDIVSDQMLNDQCSVIDIGCGSGRFIRYIDGRYKSLVGLDPSQAIFAADSLVGKNEKVELVMASTDHIPFPDDHFDFGYSLGVLHHIPDTKKALNDCVKKIKPGGYFLLYLYYKLENRPFYFRVFYRLSNVIRLGVSKLPATLKRWVCNFLAVLFYMPFVFLCRILRFFGVPDRIRKYIPLQAYERQSFYIIRNDSLDRFGTPLEQRFSRKEIEMMMKEAGLTDIVFSEKIPYWHVVGKKV
jgi:SAM-dependent methyltransferase